jgi:hypothetical protein
MTSSVLLSQEDSLENGENKEVVSLLLTSIL